MRIVISRTIREICGIKDRHVGAIPDLQQATVGEF
jgi:hypothetical protein